MSISDKNPQQPSRRDVLGVLQKLAEGTMTPTEVSEWAAPWVADDAGEVSDELVWETLDYLYDADAEFHPDEYLYGPEDFRAWLAEFRSKMTES